MAAPSRLTTLFSMRDEAVAARSTCRLCRNKAARIALREAIEQATADPRRFRGVNYVLLQQWLEKEHGYTATSAGGVREHLAKHEPALYQQWQEALDRGT